MKNIISGFVKINTMNKTISVIKFYNKYISKIKIIIIKKKVFFVHDNRNESSNGDFVLIKLNFSKSKIKKNFLIKILKLKI